MELWIRSQDKEVLMKVGNIKYVEYNGNHILNAFNTDQMGDFDIGIYKTKTRALEVLNEIQYELEKRNLGFPNYTGIYQMPTD